MNRIKIVFFDIDGTLLNYKHTQPSEKTLQALKMLKAKGTKLCIATGRAPFSLPHFDGIEFDAFLTYNGSFCFDESGTIFDSPIPQEDVKTIIRNAEALGRPVAAASRTDLAANGRDQDLEDYYSFAHQELIVSEDFEAFCREGIYQIMLGCRESDYPAILKGADGAKITAWWDRAADIIPARGGKGMGISSVLAHYHLDKSEAMAFGDGNNDIEMLEAVGTGVAMGNASPQLKEIAADICGHVAEDGIYHYCIEHGLIP